MVTQSFARRAIDYFKKIYFIRTRRSSTNRAAIGFKQKYRTFYEDLLNNLIDRVELERNSASFKGGKSFIR